jgi:hypothetical protein
MQSISFEVAPRRKTASEVTPQPAGNGVARLRSPEANIT